MFNAFYPSNQTFIFITHSKFVLLLIGPVSRAWWKPKSYSREEQLRFNTPNMSAVKIRKSPAKKKKNLPIKEDMIHPIDRRPTPPPFEVTYDIPVMDGKFLETFFLLKTQAFNMLMRKYPLKSRIFRDPKVATNMGGFLAFRAYYFHEFYHIPNYEGLKLFSKAWDACDHKHVWEYYALQYTKYKRKEGFVEWLINCRKNGSHSDLLIVES